ncbi:MULTISPECIES: hypothetical protein [Pseudomonas]|uniref:hypothetical protein n=1 Tax=Pseudomonas TaxID=286 RepID=UPI0012DFF676|nr:MULTISPECIES: hypothetical protein [Pseudomonas]
MKAVVAEPPAPSSNSTLSIASLDRILPMPKNELAMHLLRALKGHRALLLCGGKCRPLGSRMVDACRTRFEKPSFSSS